MVRISISSFPRPRLRRLICVVVVILVIWIRTWITNLPHQSQQQRKYSANSTGSTYPPGFNYSNSKLCPENGKNVKLLILITTLSTHQENRKIIRNTWRHLTISPSGRQDIIMGFMTGIEDREKGMKQEINEFDDIIIGNFVDSYGNLTLKTLSILEWALNFCSESKYLLKTDDDMWINIPQLLNFTNSLDSRKDTNLTIYGSVRTEFPVERDNKSRYYISLDHYPQQFYPDFVAGPAYLLPRNTWQSLYWEGLQTKFFKLEDVYLTGIVASKLAIQRSNVSNFIFYVDKSWLWAGRRLSSQVARAFAVTIGKISHLNHIWNAYKVSGCYADYLKGDNCKTELFLNSLLQLL